MRGRFGALLLALCTVLGVVSPAQASQVVDLGNLLPLGLNNRQWVVGNTLDPNNSDAPGHAAVWKAGVLTPLTEPANTRQSDALGINTAGRIVGESADLTGAQIHALFWDTATGTPHRIGPAPSDLDGGKDDFSFASAVDTAGEMVGGTLNAQIYPIGFFSGDGEINPLPPANSLDGITPDGATLFGRAAGDWYTWAGSEAAGVKLDVTPPVSNAFGLGSLLTPHYAGDLASDGTVLGYKGEQSATRVYYIRLPDGTETPVTGLAGFNAVNAKHTVVGTALVDNGSGGQVLHAALWNPNGTVVDLNSRLQANSGFTLFYALAINDRGDIVGVASHNNQQVGFLLPAGLVVDSTGDQVDAAPGDGACLTAQQTCTLRAALQEVSGAPASDEPTSVSFNLPSGATTISPASQLPAVTKPIAIEGSSNPGGRVVLDGASAGAAASGLRIQGDGSFVRGLDIEHFGAAGVTVQGSDINIGGLTTDDVPCPFPCDVIKTNGGPAVSVVGATSHNVHVQGDRLTGNARPAIDLGGDGRTPNDKLDADTGPNGFHNFPIGVLGEKDPVSHQLKVSGFDDISEAGELIDVYAQSSVSQARGAEPQDYVGQTKVSPTGGWELNVPDTLPAADTFFSAAVTDFADGTSELSPVCGDPDGDGNPDSDGDGLCDDWELHGIDADDDGTVDLPLQDATYGASPTHKDLYLELDAMATTTHGINAPDQYAVAPVVASFANAPVANATGGTGINLHVNPGRPTVDDTVPEDTEMTVGGTGVGTMDHIRDGEPDQACDGSFGSHDDRAAPDCYQRLMARQLAFRWVLFSNRYHEEEKSSGFSTGLGGQTLTVSVGSWDAANIIYGGGGSGRCFTLTICRQNVMAGTLMHEFGHALGLHHGGRDEENNKPNYLSVMNYLYQMDGRAPGHALDYSRWKLAPLDETALIDADGILGGADLIDRLQIKSLWPQVAYYAWDGQAAGGSGRCVLRDAASNGPIDWDGRPATATSSALLHDDNCNVPRATLTSNDDWPDLRYSFRDQPGVLDAPKYGDDPSLTAKEQTSDQQLAEAARSDADGNGVNDLADACRVVAGSDFADANGNGFADVCESDMNRLNAFPAQASGGGGGPGPAKDTTAPRLSKLTAHPRVATRAAGHHKAKPATLRFTVSEASTVTFTGERALKGRRSGKRCVTRARSGKPCVTYKKAGGSLRVDAKAGTNTVSFAAKLGKTKLAAGAYRLTAIAIDAAGNRSKPVTISVTVR